MIYTPLINKAIRLMFELHKEQNDKGGNPYCFHPFEVAELYIANNKNKSEKELEAGVCVALLHDYIEDGGNHADLKDFPPVVVDAVSALTRNVEVETYFNYIERLSGNSLARQIKSFDIICNSKVNRANDTETQKHIIHLYKTRYAKALEILQKKDENL